MLDVRDFHGLCDSFDVATAALPEAGVLAGDILGTSATAPDEFEAGTLVEVATFRWHGPDESFPECELVTAVPMRFCPAVKALEHYGEESRPGDVETYLHRIVAVMRDVNLDAVRPTPTERENWRRIRAAARGA